MSKGQESRIILKCTVCKRVGYWTHKNKKAVERKVELKKYCRWCRKQTQHKEAKR